MAYITTPDLGLELADPTTIQAFETTNVNSNFLLLEAGIIADRVRISAEETKSATQLAGPGRGTIAQWSVASLAALDAISTALIGDEAMFTADPSTGISSTSAGLEAQAYSGSGASIKWHFVSQISAATLANMDTFIAACVAITDLNTAFIVGQTFYVSDTKVLYKFTSTAGAYVLTGPARIIPTITSTGGTAAVDASTGEVTASGALTQLNVTIPNATLYKRFEVTYLFRGSTSGTYTVKLLAAGTPEATASAHRNKQLADATSNAIVASTLWTFSAGSRIEHFRKATIAQLAQAKATTWDESGGSSDAAAFETTIRNYARQTVATALDGFRLDLSGMGTIADLSIIIEGLV